MSWYQRRPWRNRDRLRFFAVDVEVVDDRQGGELVVGEAVQAVVEQGELAVASFHARA